MISWLKKSHTHLHFSKYDFCFGSLIQVHVLFNIHDSKYFIFLHLVYIMYTNPYSMILNHIASQNYFENFSKFKNFPRKILFQAFRSTGWSTGSISGRIGRPHRSTGPCGLGVHVCARLPVDRTGRPTAASRPNGYFSDFCVLNLIGICVSAISEILGATS